VKYLERFVEYLAEHNGQEIGRAWTDLGQYGPTKGWISELVAAYLMRDHNIAISIEGNRRIMARAVVPSPPPISKSLRTPHKSMLRRATDSF
jgi:hypothetical protein